MTKAIFLTAEVKMKPVCAAEKIIEKNGRKIVVCDDTRSRLLPILQDRQDRRGYISDKDMQNIADLLGIHPVEVYSVVTFYSFLSTEKKGKHVIRVSNCISNVMKGSEKVVRAFEKALKIKAGETTGDRQFTLERTGCIGMCDKAPAIMVDTELVGNVKPGMVKKIIGDLRKR
ncbi:MAG: NAD(P)H-dependent oxidoreductase subunit E [Candidatus Makaraimicrobium thalassicum]|nr:MAG: NAD(P)H-dependent oxidoreductase subunit E [Candidatus Omnitrophota bacterium]